MSSLQIDWFSRIVLAIVYIWFGILKLLDLSSLKPLILALHDLIFPFVEFRLFYLVIELAEIFIGIMFLIPRFTKQTKILFFAHILGAMAPLILLPQLTWQGFLVPNLEGQYIIKDLILMALVISLRSSKKEK